MTVAYECFIKEQRRSSIIRHSTPNNPRECETTMTTRFPSDFSSIVPSQSASQVTLNHDHEEEPLSEPVGVHSVTNAADPVSPSIATMTAVAGAPPALEPEPETELEPIVESNTARPVLPLGKQLPPLDLRYVTASLCLPLTLSKPSPTQSHPGPRGRVRCRRH